MLSETIREHLRATPFAPFAIQKNDGRRFEVPHPDFAAVSPKGGQIVIFHPEDVASITLSALLVASVEPLLPTAR
jgi:hypothetical protein